MVGVFAPIGSNSFALSAIISIVRGGRDEKGARQHLVKLSDGTSQRIDGYELEVLERHPVQIMPAEPGVRLLNIYVGRGGEADDPDSTWETPLLGWAICLDGSIRPVTPSGVDDGGNEPKEGWFVRMSDERRYIRTAARRVSTPTRNRDRYE